MAYRSLGSICSAICGRRPGLFEYGDVPVVRGAGAGQYFVFLLLFVLFLPAQVIQDLVYDAMVFNTPVRRIGDDSDRSTAEATDLDVYAKDAFKTLLPRACYHAPVTTRLSPGHRSVTFGG